MALIRYRPFADIESIQSEINDLFQRAAGKSEAFDTASQGTWLPAVNISETPNAVVFKAEIPGIDPKDLDVTVTGDILTLKGEKKREKEEKGEQWHRVERSFGTFTRSFRLPTSVINDKVSADYKNGVLLVTLPKSEQARIKEVKINVT